MKNAYKGYVSLVWAALFGLSFSNAAQAVDTAKLVEPCFACHGKNGVSTEADVPTIASYSEEYMARSLTNYKNKARPCVEVEVRSGGKKGSKSDMCKSVKDLGENDIKQIAEFFAGQAFVRTVQPFDAELAKKGRAIHKKRCENCHTEDGSLASDHGGILAGQKMSYLRQQLTFFKEGKRAIPKKMQPKLEPLESADFDALVNFWGSMQ